MALTEIQIKFPKKINSLVFEDILKEFLKASKQSNVVRFDFSVVDWCELFEISLITLWIKELLNDGKKVHFVSPAFEKVKSFLASYEFGRFLSDNGIINDLKYATAEGDTLLSTAYFPIKFLNEPSFKSLLSYLSDTVNYSSTFADILNFGFIKKAQLRNVIVQELGDNMYRHGEGLLASLAMSKFGTENTQARRTEWRNRILKNCSSLERPFFEKLNGNDYFTIVFTDKGPGIFNKLKKSFLENTNQENYTECDVLEYAFYEHSTSRSLEERLGGLAEIYEAFIKSHEGSLVMPPPTGLYMLLNIVKQFYGLLYLRSGSSIIVYDFLNGGKPIKSSNTTGLKKLAHFGGTQFKIHFPLNLNPHIAAQDLQKFLFPETERDIEYQYYRIGDFFFEENKEHYNDERGSFFTFSKEIDQFKANNSKHLSGIILDLAQNVPISTKAMFLVIAKLMSTQEKNFSHVLINLPPDLVTPLKNALATAQSPLRPIILFDTNFKREIIGVSQSDEHLFEGLFQKKFFDDELDNIFITSNDHLFVQDNSVSFKHKRKEIFKTASSAISAKIKNLILEKSNKFFYPKAKVPLSSGQYSEGYFDLFRLFFSSNFNPLLKQWLSYYLFDRRPTHLLSIGKSSSFLTKEIINERKIYGAAYTFKHFEIEYPASIDFTYLFDLNEEFYDAKNVIIFCDVVGTTKTLTNILQHFLKVNNIEILTVVNASDLSGSAIILNHTHIPINSILEKGLKFFKKIPSSWPDDALIGVDYSTNKIVNKSIETPLPLWSGRATEEFITGVIEKDNKYLQGHFIHDETHLTYLLDIPLITKNHGDEISKIILTHFTDREIQSEGVPENGKVLYLSDKEGLKDIARVLTTSLLYSTDVVQNSDFFLNDGHSDDEYKDLTIVIIDDAFNSGENVIRLLDYCNRKKAKSIFVYVLFKRGSDYSARKLSSLKQYGTAKISFHYLADIPIPTYSPHNCPACRRIDGLKQLNENLKREKGMTSLTKFIDLQIDQNQAINVKNLAAEHYSFAKYESKYAPGDLLFRILLQEAEKDWLARDYLISKISRFLSPKQSPDVLLLFRIVVSESLYGIITNKLEGENRESDILVLTIKVIQQCLKNIDEINSEDLDLLLSLLTEIDEDRFIENLNPILSQSKNDEEKINVILKHLYLSKKSYKYSETVVNALKNIKDCPAPLGQLIQNVIGRWELQLNLPDAVVLQTLEILRECNHEIEKHIDIIQGYRKDTVNNPDLNRDWHFLLDYLKEICFQLRQLGNFNFINPLVNDDIGEMIKNLKNIIDNGHNLIKNETDTARQLRTLQPWLWKMDDVLYQDKCNLQYIVESCMTNVAEIINHVLGLMEKKLEKLNIMMQLPEVPCVAFGDKNGLQAIFYNLLQNIQQHAQADKLLIKIELDGDRKNLIIQFYDNGILLNDKFEYDFGLNKCKSNATNYLGNFNLKNLESDDSEKDNFSKKATVTLKFIKTRKQLL